MFKDTKDILSRAAINKTEFCKNSIGKYLVASSWAGAYVGIGIILIMVVGSISNAVTLGNFIGGGLILGGTYYYMGKE